MRYSYTPKLCFWYGRWWLKETTGFWVFPLKFQSQSHWHMTWDILGPQKNRISLIFALPGMVRLAGDVWLHCHATKSWCYDSSWRCLQKGCIKCYWIIWGLRSTCSRLCSRVAPEADIMPGPFQAWHGVSPPFLIYGVTLRCLKGTRRFVGKYGTCGTPQSISIRKEKTRVAIYGHAACPIFRHNPDAFFLRKP